MIKLRADKIQKIADCIPPINIDSGKANSKLVVLGWGSTYGSIKTAVSELIEEGYDVAHIHLRYINPFQKNLGELLRGFEKILVPEMNSGQLVLLIRAKYLLAAKGYNKIQGLPFTVAELKEKIIEVMNEK